eukprot:12811-Heterococcus_DN1.PRE.1
MGQIRKIVDKVEPGPDVSLDALLDCASCSNLFSGVSIDRHNAGAKCLERRAPNVPSGPTALCHVAAVAKRLLR